MKSLPNDKTWQSNANAKNTIKFDRHARLQAHHNRVSWNAHALRKKVEAPTDSKQSAPACNNDAAGFLEKRAQGLRVHPVLPIHIFCHLLPCACGAHVAISTSSKADRHGRRAWQKDCTLNAKTIPFCMHSAFAFQEGCCCCWRAVARLHFRQRPRQGRHDRCYRCSRGLFPKDTKNIAMHPPAGQRQPPKLEAHFAMLCSSMAQTPQHSFQNICHGRRCFCLLLRNRPQCFAIGVPPQTTSVSHTQPAPEKTHLPLENKQKQQATQNRRKSTRLMHNHPKLRSRH